MIRVPVKIYLFFVHFHGQINTTMKSSANYECLLNNGENGILMENMYKCPCTYSLYRVYVHFHQSRYFRGMYHFIAKDQKKNTQIFVKKQLITCYYKIILK